MNLLTSILAVEPYNVASLCIDGVMAAVAVASAIVVWTTMRTPQERRVTFAGTPVDKKDFEKALEENRLVHEQLFSKLGGVERGVEARLTTRLDKYEKDSSEVRRAMHHDIGSISNDTAALKKQADLAETRMFSIEGKLDRLIERKHGPAA